MSNKLIIISLLRFTDDTFDGGAKDQSTNFHDSSAAGMNQLR